MQSEWVGIETISPWEKNPRYNEHVVQQIAVSIKEFGFLNPIIVQQESNRIIAGHTRYKAAKKLSLPKVPVIFVDLNDIQAESYAIADNKLGELASWDDGLLSEILSDLKDGGVDLSVLGFDEFELEEILSESKWEDFIDTDDIRNEIEDDEIINIVVSVDHSLYEETKEQIIGLFLNKEGITVK